MSKRLLRQLPELWHFLLVPVIAAALPWALGYRWLRRVAHWRFGACQEVVDAVLPVVPRYLPVDDPRAFAARIRLNWLLDTTDLYLSRRLRDRRRLPRHVTQVGQWPVGRNFVAAGFHYGNGFWVFRSLAAAGFDSAFLSARWDRRDFPGLPVRYRNGRWRAVESERVSGRPVIYRPGARGPIAELLRDGAVLVSLVDVPPRLAPRGQRPVSLLGQPLSLPDGPLAVAREAGIDIVPFWSECDVATGERRFVIGTPIDPAASSAPQQLADILERIIRAAPAAWSFWSQLPQWCEDAAGLHAGDDAPAPRH